jgi:hypothetical protein
MQVRGHECVSCLRPTVFAYNSLAVVVCSDPCFVGLVGFALFKRSSFFGFGFR